MAMLLLVATRETSGFAVALTVGAMKDVTPDDCPHAARAENAAPAAIERSRRDAATERKVNRAGLSSMSLPVCAENSHRGLGLRAAEFIIASPERSALAMTTGHNSVACRHNLCSRIINGFFRYANLSPFANVSLHCSIAASRRRRAIQFAVPRAFRAKNCGQKSRVLLGGCFLFAATGANPEFVCNVRQRTDRGTAPPLRWR
jgi:hypothetical protein